MNQRFLVREEVCVTLHRNAEALGENVIARSRSFLGPFDVQLVSFVGDGLPQVWISLQPHSWIIDFLQLIQLVMPDRDVGSVVLTLEDVLELHFDRVAGTVSDVTPSEMADIKLFS